MGEQLDAIMNILNSHTGSMVSQQKLNEETSRIAANNNQVQMRLTMLTARIEQMERANTPSESFSSPVTPNADEKQPSKMRSTSPPAESHKKRHKSLDTVCNTQNTIMGSQEQTQPTSTPQKKELRPHRSQTAE
eukprot:3444562-Ditylum_brightwellii.AAC.1